MVTPSPSAADTEHPSSSPDESDAVQIDLGPNDDRFLDDIGEEEDDSEQVQREGVDGGEGEIEVEEAVRVDKRTFTEVARSYSTYTYVCAHLIFN